jgi:predicted nucleic acid-binding protein
MREPAKRGSQFQMLKFVDESFAPTAHVNDLILVTRNTSDYANFQDLEIENWYR